MFTLPIYNQEGKEVDTIKLNEKVFDGIVNAEAIYQAINSYRANQRKGLAATKTRGEVSGGGKKPWKQKGTGRARVGSIRSPLWRHGGVVFGPHPRDFYFSIPQKIKTLALRSSLNEKLNENNFVVLDDFKLTETKTKEGVRVFDNLKLGFKKTGSSKDIILLLDKIEKKEKLALRNIGFLNLNLARDTHAYEVLKHKKLVITKSALTELTKRFK
ncbi:MAG: 50S ribosomal protein L4 [Candidatus Omnitrophota bacterium]|jgi:large subunit ribosomal protein L4